MKLSLPAALIAFTLSLIAAPLAAEAQQTGKIYRVGFLASGSSSAPAPTLDAFRQGLHDLGWLEGQNLALEVRWAEGDLERFPALARNLVGSRVDVLVAAGYQGVQAAREAAGSTPIVMVACDPAETIVANIARPGGNITGVTCMSSDLTPKRLQLLKEALPKASRVAVLFNPNDPKKADEVKDMERPARSLGLALRPVKAALASELDDAFTAIAGERVDAIFVLPDTLMILQRQKIADLALKNRLPSMYGFKEFVTAGGLLSYGTTMVSLFRRAAAHVDKVLKGAKPGDVPVEQAMLFELVVNLKTAKALGLTIPPSVLMRADQVIE